MVTPDSCPECGSSPAGGLTCRAAFEAALVLEYEHPDVFGQVHHFTVTCYNLQHPSRFTPESLAAMEDGLRSMLAGTWRPDDYRKSLGSKFWGSRKVLRSHPAPPVMRAWPRTTADVQLDAGPEAFISSIRAWALSIIEDLDTNPQTFL